MSARAAKNLKASLGAASPHGAPRLALSIAEACEALGVSWPTWRQHVMPEVKVVRRGRVKLVAVAELERWLSENGERVDGDS